MMRFPASVAVMLIVDDHHHHYSTKRTDDEIPSICSSDADRRSPFPCACPFEEKGSADFWAGVFWLGLAVTLVGW